MASPETVMWQGEMYLSFALTRRLLSMSPGDLQRAISAGLLAR